MNMQLKMISFFGTCTCFERRDTICEHAFEALVQNLHFGTSSLGSVRSMRHTARTRDRNGLKLGDVVAIVISHLLPRESNSELVSVTL